MDFLISFSALFHFLKESSWFFTLSFLLYEGDFAGGKWGDRAEKWSRESWCMKHKPAMWYGLILLLSYLGKFSNCHGEKHTCTHPVTHTNETPSSEKRVTGNWLWHRNLLTSFVTFRRFLLPQSPRTLHPTVLGWDFYQPSAYIVSPSTVNQSQSWGGRKRLIAEGNPHSERACLLLFFLTCPEQRWLPESVILVSRNVFGFYNR